MQPLSGNQRPNLLRSLMNMSLVLRLPREMHLSRSSANVPRLPSFLEMPQNPHICSPLTRCIIPCACHAKPHLNVQKCSEPVIFLHFWFRHVLRATTACIFSISQLPKVVRGWGALYILTWKCASRRSNVHCFDTSTSKSALRPSVFNTFDFETCFQHNGVHFPTSQVPKAHFDLEMRFAPQRRATFHLSFGHMAPHPPL